MNLDNKKPTKGKPFVLPSLLVLASLSLMGCGNPNIDEEAASAEAYDRFDEVLEKADWTNMNYDESGFAAIQEGDELTLTIYTGGFYNFFPGLDGNYTDYRDIGIYTLKENGEYLFEEHDDLELLRVILWSTGFDEFGESEEVNNLVLSLTQENFNKINWEGLEDSMLFGDLDISIFEDAYIRES